MEIDDFFSKGKELINSSSNKISNEIKDFIQDLQESMKKFEVGNIGLKIQNQIDKILDKNDRTMDYNVISYNKNHTLLSYNDNGIKCIKVPSSILPEPVNSRTVFNYQDGKFEIDERDTRLKNVEWKEKQKTATEEKEGKLYMMEEMGDDYSVVVDLDTGEYVDEPDIGFNRAWTMHEGDILIMRDGKYIPYEGKTDMLSAEIKKVVEEKQNSVETENLNMAKNLEEGSKYMVISADENSVRLLNLKDKDEFNINLYSNEYELESRFESGIFTNTFEMSKDNINSLEFGKFLIAKNGSYEIYNGIPEIADKDVENKIQELTKQNEEYIEKQIEKADLEKNSRIDGSLYWVAELLPEYPGVRVVDLATGSVTINSDIKKEEFEKLNLGDMVTVENKEYVKYDGQYNVENEIAKNEIDEYSQIHKSQRDNNAVYIVDDYINDEIYLKNTEDGIGVRMKVSEKPELGALFKYEDNTYIPYDGTIVIKNDDMKNNIEKIYAEIEKRKTINFENTKENSTHFVCSVGEDYIFLYNTKYDYHSYNSYDYFFKVDKNKYPDFKLGDFITVKDGEYVPFDGPLNIGSTEVLRELVGIYDHVMKP